MRIFNDKRQEVEAAHPVWTQAQVLAGAVAAYNSGAGNVSPQPTNSETWAQMDSGTAHDYADSGDCSRDVWNMAEWYSTNLTW